MKTTRDVRRCALQVLYQLDAGNADCDELIRQSLAEAPGSADEHEAGLRLAQAAWTFRAEADAAVTPYSADWPTNRQPVVDRNILRLAHYEIFHGLTPPKVAINEAVELAREFSTEKSPMFINAVLDRIYKRQPGHAGVSQRMPLRSEGPLAPIEPQPAPPDPGRPEESA